MSLSITMTKHCEESFVLLKKNMPHNESGNHIVHLSGQYGIPLFIIILLVPSDKPIMPHANLVAM